MQRAVALLAVAIFGFSAVIALPSGPASPDAIVPEQADAAAATNGWHAARTALWSADKDMLAKSDKAMFAALQTDLEKQDSPVWAKYMRHKNLLPPSPEGHTWSSHRGEVTGMIQENVQSDAKLCDHDVKQHHGYFKLAGAKNENYFYWLFEARHAEAGENTPLVLWLTGGPGCSSELALFTENGPCKVDAQGEKTKPNPFAWNRKSHLIFVDQPAGTGFSYGDSDTNENEIGTDLYHFMQELVKKYPQYHKSPFFITGESYAGHFVPATGARILKGNLAHEGEYIALKGIGVGNGLTNPEVQYPYYPQMAFKSKTTPKAIGMNVFNDMEQGVDECVRTIKRCQSDDSACEQAFDNCNANLIDPVQETGVNVYDLRTPCRVLPLCGDYSNVKKYLSSPRVTQALGVTKQWRTCNFGLNSQFHVDWMKDQSHHIPPMLANGLNVLIYAGDVDFICNWMGNKAWTLAMDWPGKADFNKAADAAWKVNGKVVGRERRSGLFRFLQVHKAGHMVPQDQPAVAMLMVESLIKGEALVQ
jgi:cathepsin A (carboxypeptidase C)